MSHSCKVPVEFTIDSYKTMLVLMSVTCQVLTPHYWRLPQFSTLKYLFGKQPLKLLIIAFLKMMRVIMVGSEQDS